MYSCCIHIHHCIHITAPLVIVRLRSYTSTYSDSTYALHAYLYHYTATDAYKCTRASTPSRDVSLSARLDSRETHIGVTARAPSLFSLPCTDLYTRTRIDVASRRTSCMYRVSFGVNALRMRDYFDTSDSVAHGAYAKRELISRSVHVTWCEVPVTLPSQYVMSMSQVVTSGAAMRASVCMCVYACVILSAFRLVSSDARHGPR